MADMNESFSNPQSFLREYEGYLVGKQVILNGKKEKIKELKINAGQYGILVEVEGKPAAMRTLITTEDFQNFLDGEQIQYGNSTIEMVLQEGMNESIKDTAGFVDEYKHYLIAMDIIINDKRQEIKGVSKASDNVVKITCKENTIEVDRDNLQRFLDGEELMDGRNHYFLVLQEGLNEDSFSPEYQEDFSPVLEAVGYSSKDKFRYTFDISQADWDKWVEKQKDNYDFKKSGSTTFVKNGDDHIMTYHSVSSRLFADVPSLLGKKGVEKNAIDEALMTKEDVLMKALLDVKATIITYGYKLPKTIDLIQTAIVSGDDQLRIKTLLDAEATLKANGIKHESLYTLITKALKSTESMNEASNKLESYLNDIKNNDVIDVNATAERVRPLGNNDSPEDYIPKGYFLVEKDFKITPGGGWSIGFKRGTIICSDGAGTVEATNNTMILKQAESFNPFFFKKMLPPISGERELKLTTYARNPEQRDMYNAFASSVKGISGKEALTMVTDIVTKYSNLNEGVLNVGVIDAMASYLEKTLDKSKKISHKEFTDALTQKYALPHSSDQKAIKDKMKEVGFDISESGEDSLDFIPSNDNMNTVVDKNQFVENLLEEFAGDYSDPSFKVKLEEEFESPEQIETVMNIVGEDLSIPEKVKKISEVIASGLEKVGGIQVLEGISKEAPKELISLIDTILEGYDTDPDSDENGNVQVPISHFFEDETQKVKTILDKIKFDKQLITHDDEEGKILILKNSGNKDGYSIRLEIPLDESLNETKKEIAVGDSIEFSKDYKDEDNGLELPKGTKGVVNEIDGDLLILAIVGGEVWVDKNSDCIKTIDEPLNESSFLKNMYREQDNAYREQSRKRAEKYIGKEATLFVFKGDGTAAVPVKIGTLKNAGEKGLRFSSGKTLNYTGNNINFLYFDNDNKNLDGDSRADFEKENKDDLSEKANESLNESAEHDYLYYKELVDADKARAKNSSGGENEMNMENLTHNRKMMNKAKAALKKAGKEIPKSKKNESLNEAQLLNTMEKVIAELGDRGNIKGSVAEFVYKNKDRIGDGKEGSELWNNKVADIIGYYLMDGEEFQAEYDKLSESLNEAGDTRYGKYKMEEPEAKKLIKACYDSEKEIPDEYEISKLSDDGLKYVTTLIDLDGSKSKITISYNKRLKCVTVSDPWGDVTKYPILKVDDMGNPPTEFDESLNESTSAPSLKEVNVAVSKKYPGLEVVKHNDAPSFYWYSENDNMLNYLSSLYTTTIGVASSKHMDIDRWMEEADEIMKDYKADESANMVSSFKNNGGRVVKSWNDKNPDKQLNFQDYYPSKTPKEVDEIIRDKKLEKENKEEWTKARISYFKKWYDHHAEKHGKVESTNESVDFPSQIAIDDVVTFRPMAKHQEEMCIADEEFLGVVTMVHFSKAKVFYDILSDYHGIIFDKVDSAKVYAEGGQPNLLKVETGTLPELSEAVKRFNEKRAAKKLNESITPEEGDKVKILMDMDTEDDSGRDLFLQKDMEAEIFDIRDGSIVVEYNGQYFTLTKKDYSQGKEQLVEIIKK